MTADDVIKAASGKPREFLLDGVRFFLRPLKVKERRELFAWSEAEGGKPGSGEELQARLITLAVCDPKGASILSRDHLNEMDAPIVDALAKEIARRNGLSAEGKAEPGKTPA